MTGKPVFRVSFDFVSVEGLIQFWESLQVLDTLGGKDNEDEVAFADCELVHKDALHDKGDMINHFLVRRKDPTHGNGRPLRTARISEERTEALKPGSEAYTKAGPKGEGFDSK